MDKKKFINAVIAISRKNDEEIARAAVRAIKSGDQKQIEEVRADIQISTAMHQFATEVCKLVHEFWPASKKS
jgi:hypothetical protein